MAAKRTPYERLGVAKDATSEDVRRAFRKKARQTHPDQGGSKEEFDEVHSAYMVLADPERRRQYDETGDEERNKPFPTEVIIAHLVHEAINQSKGRLAYVDIPKTMVKIAKGKIQEIKAKEATIAEKRDELQSVLDRLKDPEGVMSGILRHHIGEAAGPLSKLANEREAIESAITYLSACKYKVDKYTMGADFAAPGSTSTTAWSFVNL